VTISLKGTHRSGESQKEQQEVLGIPEQPVIVLAVDIFML
jgi:hypothetical protein